MKTRMMAIAVVISAVMCCDASANGLLSRMMGRGCGSCGDVSTCCGTPSSCSDGCGRGFSMDLHMQLPRLRRGCGDSCCGTPVSTGCASAPVVSSGCGCDAAPSCDPCGRGGLLSGLNGFGSRLGGRLGGDGCGCAAPASDCGGCASAPVSAGCGCDSASACDPCASGCGIGGKQRVRSLLGRVRSMIPSGCGGCGTSSDCGCGAPVASAGCGCDSGCGSGPVGGGCCDRAPRCRRTRQICLTVPNFGLMDRVRSLGSNRGCGGCGDSACGGCGAPVSAGCGCDGGGVAAPAGVVEPAPAAVEPTPAGAGAYNTRNQIPVVNPNSFTIQGAGYRGN